MSKEFIWTENLVSECYREIRRRFDNPNEFEGKWEGISKEIEKFKASKQEEKEKEKEVLFVTEDELEIVNPDQMIYYVSANFHIRERKAKNVQRDMKAFAEKENANEYVLMNKPCLSVNDCRNIYNSFMLEKERSFTAHCKEFAQSKNK